LVGTVIGEVLEIDPDRIRVVRPDSLSSLPSQSPVGSRMAIMLAAPRFTPRKNSRPGFSRLARMT
jgi:2-furoyl-CoA dehydrogenase large subunit